MTNIEKANKWVDVNFKDIDERDRELFVEIYLNGMAEGYHQGLNDANEIFINKQKP